MTDIRNFFQRKTTSTASNSAGNGEEVSKPKAKGALKRSLVVIDSDDDADDKNLAPQPPVKKISPIKQTVLDPTSFFRSSSVKQSDSTSVKVIKKKADHPAESDYGMDDDLLDDDILRNLVDEAEALQNVNSSTSNGILTLNNKDETTSAPLKLNPSPAKKKEVENLHPKKELTPAKVQVPSKKSTPQGVKREEKVAPIAPTTFSDHGVAAKTEESGEMPKKSHGAYFNFMKRKAEAQTVERVSRPLPVGSENCFAGKSFVFTGELLSLDRNQAQDIVKRYGGKTPSAISKSTAYVVIGAEPGPSKLKKAQDLKVKTLNEDEFYDLVNSFGPSTPTASTSSPSISLQGVKKLKPDLGFQPTSSSIPKVSSKGKGIVRDQENEQKHQTSSFSAAKAPAAGTQLWTVKYKPESYDQVIGNNNLIQRLADWLKSWNRNRSLGFPKGGKDDFSGFRAALLSGPPGIGKTTAAHLVAKLEGFEAIEFNASDTRSKKALESIVKEATLTRTVTDLFSGKKSHRKVIIMDEVDGMSAGDRGGSAELIQLIKKTATPIICICNDHSSPKMRTLAGHCLDLKFRRATAVSVEKRVKMIAAKEGLTLQPNVVGELVASTSGDIRQILNLLSTFRLGATTLSYDQSKTMSSTASKNLNLTPFDVIGKLLGVSSFRSTSFSDKMDLYFQDYSLIPLFVAENYVKMIPSLAAKNLNDAKRTSADQLKLLSQAADSICDADLLESTQRTENSWSLLPIHAVMSTIRPCFFSHGQIQQSSGYGGYGGGYAFPSWLGQNSKQTKTKRLLREIQTHMRLLTSADKNQILLSYLPLLATLLTKPLRDKDVEGVADVIGMMDHYYLSREDWDSIMELGYQKLTSDISTKAKSAFTRMYNKMNHPSPFAGESSKSTTKGSNSAELPDCEDVLLDDVVNEEEEEEEEVVVQKKPAKKAGSSKSTASSSKKKSAK